ncbi:MAG: DUF488 domain-containing protein [Pseudanabaena sp. CAN_BIN31]|nr:DUF488 domain-containing protein [Pseudanabaena sp. CAN_BIN31]
MTISTISTKNSILTFGYGNRKDYDSFLECLKTFNVTCVIDVRISPRAWTRKWYGDAIQKLCASHDILYISKTALGNVSGKSNWIPPDAAQADESLLEVAEILESKNILLLCAEMDCSKCHRLEVAKKLQEMTSSLIKNIT